MSVVHTDPSLSLLVCPTVRSLIGRLRRVCLPGDPHARQLAAAQAPCGAGDIRSDDAQTNEIDYRRQHPRPFPTFLFVRPSRQWTTAQPAGLGAWRPSGGLFSARRVCCRVSATIGGVLRPAVLHTSPIARHLFYVRNTPNVLPGYPIVNPASRLLSWLLRTRLPAAVLMSPAQRPPLFFFPLSVTYERRSWFPFVLLP